MLLGICGRAGSGKSSVAEYLVEHYAAVKIGFAYPLKQMAMDIWGFTPQQVFGDAKAKEAPDPRTGLVPRWAMQQLGQAARDHLGEDVWVNALLQQVEKDKLDIGRICVIEDLRHVNEARAVVSWLHGYVFRLHCDDSISTDKGSHPSEAQVDQIPVDLIAAEIHGSREAGLPDLFRKIDAALEKVLG